MSAPVFAIVARLGSQTTHLADGSGGTTLCGKSTGGYLTRGPVTSSYRRPPVTCSACQDASIRAAGFDPPARRTRGGQG